MSKSRGKGTPQSAGYQYRLLEVSVKSSSLLNFSNEDSIGAKLEQNDAAPEIKYMQELLIHRLLEIADESLTKHQQKVLKLHLQRKTQEEIAKKVGCTQSAVHKCLHGNISYKDLDERGDPKTYGGVIKKLIKLSAKDGEIREILLKIKNVKRDNQDDD